MNEEQRLNSSLVKEHNPPKKKVEKDYSQYFQSVYVPPSLKEAKKRGKEEVAYHKDFGIAPQFKDMGEGVNFTFVHMVVK